jgi:hypothetical protein
MAQPQLIDRYLAALQDNLGQAPDAGDILAEVEDHLRETATRYRHDGLDPQGAEARALEAFGSPRLVARAFADASGTRGLAMPALFADEWITVGPPVGTSPATTPSSSPWPCCWWPWWACAPAMAAPSVPSGWPASS